MKKFTNDKVLSAADGLAADGRKNYIKVEYTMILGDAQCTRAV